jgi:hypothetical protein
MNWNMFAKSARLVKRRVPSTAVRYRPSLDVLEDRTLLSPVSFNEVQYQSILALSGTIAGRAIQPQGPGSLTTTYFGTFQTNIDEAAGGISFIATGNDFCAANSGNWAPRADGSSGTAPAIYGAQANFAQIALVALRDFHLNADTGGSALPLHQNADGSFAFPSSQTITISAGSGTYSQPTFGHGPVELSGLHGPNQAGDGHLVDNGNGTFVITVPISAFFSGTANGIMYTLNVNGQIVGTGAYTGPGAGGHSSNDPAIGAARVWGTQSIGTASPAATGTTPHDLPSQGTRGVAATTAEIRSLAQDARPGDAATQLVHQAILAAVDPFTALDAVFQDLA